MIKEKSCGCIVFNEENQVLLVKMKLGHWSFPKGHVEAEETEEETALREVKEETNIDCVIMNSFREISTYSPYPGVIKDVVFFIAKSIKNDITIQETEIAESGFYNVQEAKKLITFDNDLKIFDMALKHKKL
ncbi:NUDIX domain-containing protein [Mycoplasmatota bacterium WC30]